MALAARRDARMSVAEYRVWVESRPDAECWELLDGEPVPMSPPRERHQRIVYNLLRRVGDLPDMRVLSALPGLAILSEAMDDFAPIPDVVVRCGPELPDGYARDPLLIVYQNEPRVEAWQRSRGWEMQVFGASDRIDLPELGGDVAVADIHTRVAF